MKGGRGHLRRGGNFEVEERNRLGTQTLTNVEDHEIRGLDDLVEATSRAAARIVLALFARPTLVAAGQVLENRIFVQRAIGVTYGYGQQHAIAGVAERGHIATWELDGFSTREMVEEWRSGIAGRRIVERIH